jgi:hypothetical protein
VTGLEKPGGGWPARNALAAAEVPRRYRLSAVCPGDEESAAAARQAVPPAVTAR